MMAHPRRPHAQAPRRLDQVAQAGDILGIKGAQLGGDEMPRASGECSHYAGALRGRVGSARVLLSTDSGTDGVFLHGKPPADAAGSTPVYPALATLTFVPALGLLALAEWRRRRGAGRGSRR